MKVCIDSNIFISIKNAEENAVICEKIIRAIETHEIEGVISSIAITELLVGYYKMKKKTKRKHF
jgi:predicted nucleic acid-binding protein